MAVVSSDRILFASSSKNGRTSTVSVLDKLTYAGNLQNLDDLIECERLAFVRGDIADPEAVRELAKEVDAIVNFAAESHVDRSILDASPFIRTNIVGTQVLLDNVRELGIRRFVQISTDEVYGSLGASGRFTESTPLAPNSPYSASKAAADLLVRAYIKTHGINAVVLRSSNAYGPYQFPEKLIPLMITNAQAGEDLPVYGDGLQVRDWVHVDDLVRAVLVVLEQGDAGEIYNVGGDNEIANLEVVRLIVAMTGASEAQIRFVDDRPGHDLRYAMDFSRLADTLGWRPERGFETGLRETIEWYGMNESWVSSVKSGTYRRFYAEQYAERLGLDIIREDEC